MITDCWIFVIGDWPLVLDCWLLCSVVADESRSTSYWFLIAGDWFLIAGTARLLQNEFQIDVVEVNKCPLNFDKHLKTIGKS